MSSLSDASAQAYMNLYRGIDVLGFQADLALFEDDPRAGGIEIFGGGYARQPVTFAAPVGKTMVNSLAVVFPNPTADYSGPIGYAALMNGAVVWDVVAVPATEADRTVLAGSAPVAFAVGAILVRRT